MQDRMDTGTELRTVTSQQLGAQLSQFVLCFDNQYGGKTDTEFMYDALVIAYAYKMVGL